MISNYLKKLRVLTIVSFNLTFPAVLSSEVERALAIEIIRKINTRGNSRARARSAIRNILLAVFSSKPGRTRARERVFHVRARRPVLAHVVVARVVLVLASYARVLCGARTVEAAAVVEA